LGADNAASADGGGEGRSVRRKRPASEGGKGDTEKPKVCVSPDTSEMKRGGSSGALDGRGVRLQKTLEEGAAKAAQELADLDFGEVEERARGAARRAGSVGVEFSMNLSTPAVQKCGALGSSRPARETWTPLLQTCRALRESVWWVDTVEGVHRRFVFQTGCCGDRTVDSRGR
jgi:hypothetical protein